MWVKICGTTTLADAQLAVASGADATGFVFAPSRRRVNAQQVAQITSSLPETIEKIGVFHAANADEITQTVRIAGLTGAQLHFLYDVTVVAALASAPGPRIKLLQVVSCSVESLDEAALTEELVPALNDTNLWGILLDASKHGVSGGTGMNFEWSRAASVLDHVWAQRQEGEGPKLILAGGLRPENVREAIACLRPFGVDVVSGVEALPGTKDPNRVREFVSTARL